ncbi:MAG: spore coat protein [Clostridia bacterium]
MKLTPKEIMIDALICEKYMINAYSKFIMEASCRPLIDLLTTNAANHIATQHAIFKEMEKRGMYPVTEAKQQELSQAISTADDTKKCYKDAIKK